MFIALATSFVLSGCGGAGESTKAGEDASTPASVVDSSAQDELTFAKNGDTVTVKVGEELSIKLELPQDAGSSVQWVPTSKTFPEIVKESRTYRSVEGKVHYSDVIVTGVQRGTASVSFAKFEKGAPVDEQLLAITLVVE